MPKRRKPRMPRGWGLGGKKQPSLLKKLSDDDQSRAILVAVLSQRSGADREGVIAELQTVIIEPLFSGTSPGEQQKMATQLMDDIAAKMAAELARRGKKPPRGGGMLNGFESWG